MVQVCKYFMSSINQDPLLCYRITIGLGCLLEDSSDLSSTRSAYPNFVDRHRLLTEHQARWVSPKIVLAQRISSTSEARHAQHKQYPPWNVIMYLDIAGKLLVVQLPSQLHGVQEGILISHQLDPHVRDFAADPAHDLLALVEYRSE